MNAIVEKRILCTHPKDFRIHRGTLYIYTILICCSYISGNKYVIFKLDYQKKRILRLTKGLAMSRMSYKTIVLFSGTLAERAGLESVL